MCPSISHDPADSCINAIVYCEGALKTPNGKTAHGLVRRSERFHITSVVDSTCAGLNASDIVQGALPNIPIVDSVQDAIETSKRAGTAATMLLMGLAPDGGRLPDYAREDIGWALDSGLDVASGLHDALGDDAQLASRAARSGVRIFDIRKPPAIQDLHFFSGVIDQVKSYRIAVLGTDSAVGKRTTAWMLVDGLRKANRSVQLIGTGQTAWLQGARYSIVLDSIVNDFVAGELEHVVHRAWMEERPDVLVLEGQGSLLNPAYPGGFELLAATRPHGVVLQHVPARASYDGFPGFPIHPLEKQIAAIEMISDRPVVAITINSEGMSDRETLEACEREERKTGLPTVAPLIHGVDRIVAALIERTPVQK